MKFVAFGPDGYEVKRGECPADLLEMQAGPGETVVPFEWDHQLSTGLFCKPCGTIIEQERAPSQERVNKVTWREMKREMRRTLMAGYPHPDYGLVDMRDGARAAMNSAVALGRGIELILMDNSRVSLSADELRELLTDIFEWEQGLVMATQAVRPSA